MSFAIRQMININVAGKIPTEISVILKIFKTGLTIMKTKSKAETVI